MIGGGGLLTIGFPGQSWEVTERVSGIYGTGVASLGQEWLLCRLARTYNRICVECTGMQENRPPTFVD